MIRVPVLMTLVVFGACSETPRATSEQAISPDTQRVDSVTPRTPVADAPEARAGAVKSMREFRAVFDSAVNPKREDLIGEWVLVQVVWAEEGEPEDVRFDVTGLRGAQHPLEWKLVITGREAGELSQTSEHPWTSGPLPGMATFADNGELLIDTEFGGDSRIDYRCRARTPDRLVCLVRGAVPFDGREFLKIR